MVSKKMIGLTIAGSLAAFGAGNLWAHSAYAEGSQDLVQNGGNRPFLEWDTSQKTAGIARETLLHVYAKAGETINLGSSVYDAVDGSTKDIVVTYPDGSQHYLDVKQSGEGYIDTITKEKNGPFPNNGGYTPLTIPVNQTGWYLVSFQGQAGMTASNPTPVSSTSDFLGKQNQNTVAAWDITVTDQNGSEKTGRVYANYLALNMGGSGVYLNSKLYVLTKDGYEYLTDLNSIDPFGFIFFSDNRGFIDGTSGQTLYHSVPISNGAFAGGVTVQDPSKPDTSTDVTHRVFFNQPSADLPIPTSPITPPTPTNFSFLGSNNSGNIAYLGEGGQFQFSFANQATYQIIIDSNQDGKFDPVTDIVLEDTSKEGTNLALWNGKDRNGNDLPVGTYQIKLISKGGEYHFPMLDVENAPNGIKINLLNAPGAYPSGMNASSVFYDDSNYKTASGTSISLDGTGAPSPRSALNGFDSSGGVQAFANNYGNDKGIDVWTYFPGPSVESTLVVTNKKITGTIFNDADRSGTDNSESGIAGIKVNITDVNGNTQTVTTDNAGKYSVNVTTGTYTISIDEKSSGIVNDHLMTGNSTQTITVSSTSSGTINAEPVGYSANQAPVLNDITATDQQNQTTTGLISGSDPDQDTLLYTKGSNPQHGTATVQSNGTWSYKPENGFYGDDSFEIITSDGFGGTATANVMIHVNSVPTVENYTVETNEGNSVGGTVVGSDADGNHLTYSLGAGPNFGTATVKSDGTWAYKPNDDYAGSDTFTVLVDDGHGGTTTSTVTINVNTVPTVENYTVETNEGNSVGGTVVGSDADGNHLTYSLSTGPNFGTVTVKSDGTWAYTPNDDYAGSDTFTVLVDDGHGGTTTSTVIINVNTVPTVKDYTVETNEGESVNGTVVGRDADGNNLSYSLGAEPGNGTVTVKSDGKWTYTPNDNYAGTDSFTVLVDDGHGGIVVSTIKVKVYKISVAISGGNHVQTIDTTPTISGHNDSSDLSEVDVTIKDQSGHVVYHGITTTIGGSWQLDVPNSMAPDDYVVIATITDGNLNRQSDATQTLTIKRQKLSMAMTASPASIVGDGKTNTLLTITLLDASGRPIINESVTLSAEAGKLSMTRVMTNSEGEATVYLTSPDLEGTIKPLQKIVTAQVNDPNKGLFATASVVIRFQPAAIESQVVNAETHQPIVGALVEVHEDFNHDGRIDFTATSLTDADGYYRIPVPYGNWTYHPVVTTSIEYKGVTIPVEIHQTAVVGELQGTGEKFKTGETVTGKIMMEDPVTKMAETMDDFFSQNGITVQSYVLNGEQDDVKVVVNDSGQFKISGGKKGKTYVIAMDFNIDGKILVGPKMRVTIPEYGISAVQPSLIDPFGIVRDHETGKALSGVKVTLYWADTALNRLKGRIPGTKVLLPFVQGFPPHNNESTQLTTDLGAYAWMVFPDADYYIIATKDGYVTYDSRKTRLNIGSIADDSYVQYGIIHVGKTLLSYDIQMDSKTDPVDHSNITNNQNAQQTQNYQQVKTAKKAKNKLPKTGSLFNQYFFTLIGSLITLLGAVLHLIGRKEKEDVLGDE